jgi:hypothetical protein
LPQSQTIIRTERTIASPPPGKRGAAGEKGERGPSGPRGDAGATGAAICDWKIDRACYVATPLMSDGREGPPLELGGLFEQFFLEAR